jgi:hypothetical protein
VRRARSVPSHIPRAGHSLAEHPRFLMKPRLPTHTRSLRAVEERLVTHLDFVHRRCDRGSRVLEDGR